MRALKPPGPIDTSLLAEAIVTVARDCLAGSLPERLPAIVDVLAGALPRFRDRPVGASVQPEGPVDGRALAETIDALDRRLPLRPGAAG